MMDQPPLIHFADTIPPDHECPGEDCPYPPGMYLLVIKDPSNDDPNSFLSSHYAHGITPAQLIQALVDFVDTTYQKARGEMPAMIAHAKGRDLLRAAVETQPPPPAVSEEIAHFAESNFNAWKDLIDGEE